jgi:hypothetical protein
MPATSRFFSDTERAAIKAAFGYTCAACGVRDDAILEADHWAAYNGENTVLSNAVCLCGPCNRAKGKATMIHAPLKPRNSKLNAESVDEYIMQVAYNRGMWNEYCNTVKDYGTAQAKVVSGKAKSNPYRKPKAYRSPY